MKNENRRSWKWMALVLASLALGGCKKGSEAQPAPKAEPAPAPAADPAPAAAAKPAAPDPIAQLAAMDSRTPVPLQPMMAWHQKENMQQHLVAIQRITAALGKDDWDEVADAAKLIESSPQMAMMCKHMGAGADGFTEKALDFHRRADAIAPAAKKHDAKAVLAATAHTLEACTSCHATYRQEIVDAVTWTQKTGQTMDMSHMDPAAMHGDAK